MGKGLLSILILIASFFFSDEAQARALSREVKKVTVEEHSNHDLLSVIVNAHRFDLEQNLIRVVPASRCGQVHKYVGNGYWSALSFSAAGFPYHIPCISANVAAKSSYLSHIYPSHNFW